MGIVADFNTTMEIWLAKHGFPNVRVSEGESFAYYPETHLIQWGMLIQDSTDRDFQQFFHEYDFQFVDYNVSVMSFLHELGHHMTLSAFTDLEREEVFLYKTVIDEMDAPQVEKNFIYWELEPEFSANIWAMRWAEAHPDDFIELHQLFQKWMDKIFSNKNILAQIEYWIEDVKNGELIGLYILEDEE